MPTSQGSSTAQANPRPRKLRRRAQQRTSPADLPLDLIPGYDPRNGPEAFWFDEDAARRAIDFFSECLTFTAGQWRGQPFVLQPWQKAVTANLFGWKRRDGTRRYRALRLFNKAAVAMVRHELNAIDARRAGQIGGGRD